jgi:hypothetical protein
MMMVQGWKGSVKSKSLVLALRDHFVEKARPLLQIEGPKTSTDSTQRKDMDDMWTLQYLTVIQAQPLLEALDDDFSSYVTIAEINSFTSSRPENWR